jgi:hypothetical protein
MLTRRDFIKFMSLVGGVVLNPFQRLGSRLGIDLDVRDEEVEGELYSGFVLLPEGAPIPPFVQCASAPILGQVDDGLDPDALAIRGETIWFDDLTELISHAPFITYVPNSLPSYMKFIQGNLIRFTQSGKIFAVGIDYGSVHGNQPLISVSARPIFPHPYPIWPINLPLRSIGLSSREQEEMVLVTAEKVDFTPTPGVMLPTERGSLLHWIKQDILYTLVVEHDQKREASEEIVKYLVETSLHR